MPDISISLDGVKSLLGSIDVKRAWWHTWSYIFLNLSYRNSSSSYCYQSLNTGEHLKDWLIANITPVFKKVDRCNPTNYHPISLTSVHSKIMEHILYHSIIENLNLHHILKDHQFSFWSGTVIPVKLNLSQ